MAPQQPHDHTRGNTHGVFFQACHPPVKLYHIAAFLCVQDLNDIKLLPPYLYFSPQDTRFKLFRNGTIRINNVEVYDGQMYSCETRTLAGRLSGHARVSVLGELRGSLGSSVKHAGFLLSVHICIWSDERNHKSDVFYLPG